MKQAICSQEDAVARALRTGSWPEQLAAHAERCGICRDVAQITRRMLVLAGSLDETDASTASQEARPLPDPGLVWQRARLDEEHANNRTAFEWVQIGIVAVPIGLAGWVAFHWFSIQAMAEQFLLTAWPQLAPATYLLAGLAPAALTAAALGLGYPLLDSE